MSTSTRTPPARVSALRTLSIVLAFTAAVGLVFGTAGFTAMEADRGVAANVTNDESAYLGYEPVVDDREEIDEKEPTDIVEFRNQFGVNLTEFHVDVSAHDSDVSAELDDPPEILPKGNESTVEVTLHCDVEKEVPLELSVNGSGGDVSVSLNRTVTVVCVPEEPEVTGVTFNDAANAGVGTQSTVGGNSTGNDGNGNARVNTERGGGEVTAHVWLAPNPPNKRADDLTEVEFEGNLKFDASRKVRPQINQNPSASGVPGNWKIAAIEFPNQGVTYVHPGWDNGKYTSPKSGDGVEYGGTVDEDFLLNAVVEGGQVVDASNDGEESDD
ncbi:MULTISPECIES: hypothetical protein [Haloferacaceae]|uniref:SipW-cognate class signal peptide n=1 Tax=Halorubrum glutamatedens TaxID=2707018 RepID=A0ABD5QQY6_9EURY|nr:hypothetical protein [Halobellus captivus]